MMYKLASGTKTLGEMWS